jgi:hypothetical protein
MPIVVSLNTVSTTVSFNTVVWVYCCTGSVYYCNTVLYCITSLPVYPNTIHGHCTTVVLDTSNSIYCVATLMECTVQCTATCPRQLCYSNWLSYHPLAVPYIDFPRLHIVDVTYIAMHSNLVDWTRIDERTIVLLNHQCSTATLVIFNYITLLIIRLYENLRCTRSCAVPCCTRYAFMTCQKTNNTKSWGGCFKSHNFLNHMKQDSIDPVITYVLKRGNYYITQNCSLFTKSHNEKQC